MYEHFEYISVVCRGFFVFQFSYLSLESLPSHFRYPLVRQFKIYTHRTWSNIKKKQRKKWKKNFFVLPHVRCDSDAKVWIHMHTTRRHTKSIKRQPNERENETFLQITDKRMKQPSKNVVNKRSRTVAYRTVHCALVQVKPNAKRLISSICFWIER